MGFTLLTVTTGITVLHHHNHHHHSHPHAPQNVLLLAVACTMTYAIIEASVGWWSGSLTLLSDSGHMLSDAFALAVASFAAWIARRPPSEQHTYGLGRAEVIGAWFSSLILLGVVVAIIVEAIERLNHPRPVAGGVVMLVATVGLMINMLIAWLISRAEKTLNTRAALLHVLSDVLGSIAAMISGAVVYFKHWMLIDPILSIFICLLILFATLSLLRESVLVLMEGVPPHLDITKVGHAMAKVAQVNSVHDLHIWTLASGTVLLSAHLEIDDLTEWRDILENLRALLKTRFGIEHITLQPEIPFQVLQEIKRH